MLGIKLGQAFEKLSGKEIERRRQLLNLIVKVHLTLVVIFTPILVGAFAIYDNAFVGYMLWFMVLVIPVLSLDLYFIQHGSVRFAVWIEIVTALVSLFYLALLTRADGTLNLLYAWPLLLSALILDGRATLLTGLISLGSMASSLLLQTLLGIWPPLVKVNPELLNILQFIFGVGGLAVLIAVTLLVATNMGRALRQAELEAESLAQANQEIHLGEEEGREQARRVNQLAAVLVTASQQQAEGAQEQVAAVVQVTASLEELSETARQIAYNTGAVVRTTSEAVSTAVQTQQTGEQAGVASARGKQAIEGAISTIEVVRNRIELLGQRLLNLTERSRQINSVNDLLREIADETHLLSLNAAIESAGLGEAGRRFAIIAQEIKNLADRSLEATQDVRGAISELQGAVAAAVLAAEEGKKETGRAVERSYQAGAVIAEMNQAVCEAAEGARYIVKSVEMVNLLCEEINLATRQQQSASSQIVSTMHGIAQVAQETAHASTGTNQTVQELQILATQLEGRPNPQPLSQKYS